MARTFKIGSCKQKKMQKPVLYANNVRDVMGGPRISGNGVHINEGVGVRFADFISLLVNIPWKWNYHRIFKNWGGGGGRVGFQAKNRNNKGLNDRSIVLQNALLEHSAIFLTFIKRSILQCFWPALSDNRSRKNHLWSSFELLLKTGFTVTWYLK